MNVLFVYAHQDDEIAGAARMLLARRNGDRVVCAYLTDGAARVAAPVRNEESRRALARLGVTDLLFAPFPDGALPEHADGALAFLESNAGDVSEVWTLAWEGGHQDHDAAHVIALAFARSRGVPCREQPLYNGFGTPTRFFRTMHPLGDGWTTRRIRRSEALRIVALARFYKSQRKTWLGLLPEAIVKLVFLRREFTRDADPRRLASKPHDGPLFYERRFGYSWNRLSFAMQGILRRLRGSE